MIKIEILKRCENLFLSKKKKEKNKRKYFIIKILTHVTNLQQKMVSFFDPPNVP